MKKVKVTIGQTYIYDVLGETNISDVTTVIVKEKVKRHKYLVIGNTGKVFVCEDKYLTPPLKDVDTLVTRVTNNYTEFNESDHWALRKAIDILKIIDGPTSSDETLFDKQIGSVAMMLSILDAKLISVLRNNKERTMNEILSNVQETKLRNDLDGLEDKIKQLTDIMNNTSTNIARAKNAHIETRPGISEFKKNFSKFLDSLVKNSDNDFNEIVRKIKLYLLENYPIYVLLNGNDERCTDKTREGMINSVKDELDHGMTCFLVYVEEYKDLLSISDYDDCSLSVKVFTDVDEKDDVEEFINDLFGKYNKNSDGVYYDMEYGINDISIAIKDAIKEAEEDDE